MIIPDWNGKPYHSLDYELKHTFGRKLYKLSLDGGMTCPNRDGTCGSRGCIFCSEGGSGDFAAPLGGDVWRQIEAAKERIRRKMPPADGSADYIAYFSPLPTPMPPLIICPSCFPEPFPIRKLRPYPSPPGPTACRMKPSLFYPV